VRTPSEAGQLALAIPGAGHLYSGRPIAAILRFLSELAVFVILALGVLSTTDGWRVAAIVAAGLGLLAVMKLHGMWSARLLAERAGVVSARAGIWWRWAVPVGLVGSVAVLLAPLPLAGNLDQQITWELMLIHSQGDWRRLEPESSRERPTDGAIRSVWARSDGRRVTVRARPLPPFQSIARTTQKILAETEAPQTAHTIGAFTTFRLVGKPDEVGSRITTRVLDAGGRDIHDVETIAEPGQELEARRLLTHFLERSIWVRTVDH
jgi:hypothetical protein